MVALQNEQAVTVFAASIRAASSAISSGPRSGNRRARPAEILVTVPTLAFPDQVLNGHLPPQIEIKLSRARAAKLAHAAGPLMHFRRIAEQRLAIPVVVISHGQSLRSEDRRPR